MFYYSYIMFTLILSLQMSTVFCHIKDLGETQNNYYQVMKLIVGGITTSLESFPYVVQFFNKGGLCAGSILTPRTVLTAAHCFDFNKNIGEMMVLSAAQNLLDRHRQQHKIWEFRAHPEYNKRALFSDDIAVALLQDPFVFGNEVQPATLVNTDEWMRVNETFTATGWGQTTPGGDLSFKGLMKATLHYVPLKECKKVYEGLPFSPEMFCLFGNGTADTCKGDSGGGIVWRDMVVGIVSHGNGCAKHPGIYASVYYYSDWIKNVTDEMYSSFCRFKTFG